MSINTNAPVNLDEWSSAVAPIIGTTDSSLSALPGTAENFYRVAHESYHQIASGHAPLPLARCNYSTDALLKPSCSAVEDETACAYSSQTAWYEGSVTLTQLDGNQVPPETRGLDAIGKSWSQHDDAICQAAVALAQPTSLYGADYSPHSVPAGLHMATFPEIGASLTSQAHMTGLGNVSSRVAGAALGHVASPVNHRRYHCKPHARPERVVCDKCNKKMRRQSLRRHVREVHDHVKRPHARSNCAAGS
ncbi:hypothetical protein J3R82DRAFT_4587 [Butyriboletus roseoflavus]|nr:hypothetical protein J3R82DRAFT_4587 [Butyriboletus roseoflavus]